MEKVCIYFSGTNSTKTLMDYFHEKIHFDKIINITNRWERDFVAGFYELIFIFFPIYGQTIPRIVFDVLKKLRGKNAVICVTYGGIN
ncbi:MAG TPA: hypothetical protein GXZ48_04305, partial [Acholeplasmataceae bacterium]|nr:hypothetical protein [Acholeplasmataceae bacterium]